MNVLDSQDNVFLRDGFWFEWLEGEMKSKSRQVIRDSFYLHLR
jgi:hypothetical protein